MVHATEFTGDDVIDAPRARVAATGTNASIALPDMLSKGLPEGRAVERVCGFGCRRTPSWRAMFRWRIGQDLGPFRRFSRKMWSLAN